MSERSTTAAISIDTEQLAVSFRDDLRAANQAYPCVSKKNDNTLEEASTRSCSLDGDKQIEDSQVSKTFAEGGEQRTQGSAKHPNACTPCAFYCFRKKGCPSGEGCDYCHMGHESKSRNRRDEWKQAQTERRKVKRATKGDVDKLDDSNEVKGTGASDLTMVSPGSPPQPAASDHALKPQEPCYIAIDCGRCALYQEGMML